MIITHVILPLIIAALLLGGGLYLENRYYSAFTVADRAKLLGAAIMAAFGFSQIGAQVTELLNIIFVSQLPTMPLMSTVIFEIGDFSEFIGGVAILVDILLFLFALVFQREQDTFFSLLLIDGVARL